MKKVILIIISILLIGLESYSFNGDPEKYFSKSGHVWFLSEAPLETIEAHNHKVLSILDAENGRIEISMLIKAFLFEKALMQEHFNENYLESDLFPKSKFSGKIDGWNPGAYTEGEEYKLSVSGALEIHGIKKEVEVTATIQYLEGHFQAKGSFSVNLSDFNIEIPSVVKGKIAEKVEVNFDIDMSPYTK